MLKIHDGRKALVYLIPLNDAFRMSMAIREAERDELLADVDLAALHDKLASAKTYSEGFALQFDVDSEMDFGPVESFIGRLDRPAQVTPDWRSDAHRDLERELAQGPPWSASRSGSPSKQPDVLLMQETKLADEAAPELPSRMAGYHLAHHGEGRWNGVAIASRVGISDVVTNFGDGPVRRSPGTEAIAEAVEAEASEVSADEARMISAVCGGVRVVSIYAPNGRALDTPFYRAKLAWFDRLARWLRETCDPNEQLAIGGDYNVAPEDADVYDMADLRRRHPRLRARASRGGRPPRLGPRGRLPAPPPGARQVLVVGLPRGQLPQGPGHAHRPHVRHEAGGRPLHRRGDRPRRAQGQAAVGSCPGLHRPGGLSGYLPAGGWHRRRAGNRSRTGMLITWPTSM